MYADEQLLKACAQQNAPAAPQSEGDCMQAKSAFGGYSPRLYTLQEEAQKSEQHHYQEAAKAGQAALFLAQHPEFDEFIRLIRSGAIRF